MILQLGPEQRAFRDEVRAFIAEALPAALARKVRLGHQLERDDYLTWQHAVARRGWYAPAWPKEHGGAGWDALQRHIFEEECAAAHAPRLLPFGVNMVGPVIIRFGTPQQKAHYLPRILSGEDWWCQGYSEPGAGSDLASLKTRAVRDGEHYVVSGQKTWTTLGQHANRMFCLVRTDPQAAPQRGISFLLLDMQAPGVSVRPIRTLDGSREVNEVFLDEVRVPLHDCVGEENTGWTCAKYLLTHERTGLAGVGASKAALAQLKAVAAEQRLGNARLLDDALFRAQLAEVEMQLMAVEISTLRMIAAAGEGAVPGAESSILKIRGTEIRQAISHLMRKAAGSCALPFLADELEGGAESLHAPWCAAAAGQYFNLRKSSIYGGSNEIQKNILAKALLGL